MRNNKKEKITVTIRLTPEQHEVLQRLCGVKHTTQSAYLAYLGTEQARKELLDYAVQEYVHGRASLSELATRTGLDIPSLMKAIAAVSSEDKRGVDAFLSAAKTLSKAHNDPEFYELAVKALAR